MCTYWRVHFTYGRIPAVASMALIERLEVAHIYRFTHLLRASEAVMVECGLPAAARARLQQLLK